jgi:hypothetical protein
MIMVTISFLLNIDSVYNFFFSDIGSTIRGILALLSIIFWVYCISIWAKFDKKVYRLFMLIFLTNFYTIFYFRRILREGWMFKSQAD